MMKFGEFNPIAATVYFIAVTMVSMFTMNPILLVISLCGAVLLRIALGGDKAGFVVFAAAVVAVSTLINPIFDHNGVTPLFFINSNAVTLEAIFRGTAAGLMLCSALIWFRSFSQIMTSDRLLYILSGLTPGMALVLSMTLRYIPLFGKQAKRVEDGSRGLGLYKDDNLIDDIRGKVRIFSVMVTWALENGVITANSMTARGYGIGRRTRFSVFRFRKRDAALIVCSAALTVVTAAGIITGACGFEFYPAIKAAPTTAMTISAYVCYGLLAILPDALELFDRIKWRALTSVIEKGARNDA